MYPVLDKIERQFANVNDEFALQFSATNSPDSYSITRLPNGLSIDKTSGLISGVPTISGTFSIQVTAKNEYGKGFQRFLLTVNHTQVGIAPLQITMLTTSVNVGIAPLSTQFALEASGGSGSYEYHWDFGDETNSTERAPAHTYTEVGDYQVVATVTDVADSNSRATGKLTIIVTDASTVFSPLQITLLNASVSVGVAPLVTNFTVQASGGSGKYDYVWDFDDGQSTTSQNPSHTFTDSGQYKVKVTVTDLTNSLKTTTGELSVIVNDTPNTEADQQSQSENNSDADNGNGGGGILGIWFLLGVGMVLYRRFT